MDLSPFNPFNYSLSQAKAMVLQFVASALLLAGAFIAFDPSTEVAVTGVVTAVFGVIGVFAAKNITADQANKSLVSLLNSGVVLASLMTSVPDDLVAKGATVIGALVPPLLVFLSKNSIHDYTGTGAAVNEPDAAFILSQPDDVDEDADGPLPYKP